MYELHWVFNFKPNSADHACVGSSCRSTSTSSRSKASSSNNSTIYWALCILGILHNLSSRSHPVKQVYYPNFMTEDTEAQRG